MEEQETAACLQEAGDMAEQRKNTELRQRKHAEIQVRSSQGLRASAKQGPWGQATERAGCGLQAVLQQHRERAKTGIQPQASARPIDINEKVIWFLFVPPPKGGRGIRQHGRAGVPQRRALSEA